MTDKAKKILAKFKKKRIRDKFLHEFNQSTLDDVGSVGNTDQEMKILKEMNELQEFENDNWSKGCLNKNFCL
jgi:hypothetical protein